MAPQVRTQWHWLDNFILFLRFMWLIASIVQYSSLVASSPFYWFTLVWLIASFLLPLYYFRPHHLNVNAYYLAELIITGPLYIYLLMNGQLQALSFIGFQVIIFGYLGTASVKSKWMIGMLFVLIIPLSNIAGHFQLPVWEMVKKFFDFVLFYGLGVCLNLVVRSNQIIQEKNKALEQHYQSDRTTYLNRGTQPIGPRSA